MIPCGMLAVAARRWLRCRLPLCLFERRCSSCWLGSTQCFRRGSTTSLL